MIYTQWEDVVGKAIVKVEHYFKEFTSKSIYDKVATGYMNRSWDIFYFSDGVLIQEFTNTYYEGGDLFMINEVDKDEPPVQDVIDIIEKYK